MPVGMANLSLLCQQNKGMGLSHAACLLAERLSGPKLSSQLLAQW